MKIAVIGMGGVGGYFGGKIARYIELQQNSELQIYFVARGKHLKEIKEHGLILNTKEDGDFICRSTVATDNFDELPVLDLILLCVKSYDLPGVLNSVKSKIHENTRIIPLLNGIDIYDRVRSKISNGYVLPSCAYVGTHIERPGKVTQRGGACKILVGSDPLHTNQDVTDILSLFDRAGVRYEWLDNSYPDIWKKYIFIASFGLITAALDKTIGEVIQDDEMSQSVKAIMEELKNIAAAKSISLPDDIVQISFDTALDFPFETKTSFHRDFENPEKPDERDLFGNTILRYGRESGVDTPVSAKFSKMIDERKSELHY